MIVYFDTSAFVPLVVAEPGSPGCRRLWDNADAAVSSRLLHVEVAAALAQAHRLGRLGARAHRAGLKLLDILWSQMDVAEVDQTLVERAAAIAHRFALRGYDAVHCATADQFKGGSLVAAAGDRRLLAAWTRLGLATFDSNQPETST